MKQIPLTQGKIAIVDDADYDWLNQYKWCSKKDCPGNFYAVRQSPREKGKQYLIYMHRQILGLELGDKRQADHINHSTLDNRRGNIRVCICQQNHFNRKSTLDTSSKYKGVSWYSRDKKWRAQITLNGKVKFLGYWIMEEIAALRYDMVAIREHGEFAHLNF